MLFALAAVAFSCPSIGAARTAVSRRGDRQAAMSPSVGVRFAVAINELARRANVAVVAEGTPIEDRGRIANAASADSTVDGNIARIAEEFDYSVHRVGRIVVMTKRYSDPRDLPDVTPEEGRLALGAIARVLAEYGGRPARPTQAGDPRIGRIARLLTPEQAAALERDGLPVAMLTTEQRAEVWRIALGFYAQPGAKVIGATSQHAADVLKQNPLFKRQMIASVDAFGYRVHLGRLTKDVFFPLSNLNSVVVDYDGSVISVPSWTNNGSVEPPPDETDPQSAAAGAIGCIGRSPTSVTLKQVIAKMNDRTMPLKPFSVDSAIAPKTVTLAAEKTVAPDRLMAALALVYGLRVIRQREGTVLLTLPADPVPSAAGELAPAIARTVPAPLLHALRARRQDTAQGIRGAAGGPPKVRVQALAHKLQMNALRALRGAVEPKVRAAVHHEVALSDLPNDEQALFGLSLMAGAFGEAWWICDRVPPPYIASFDRVVLTGSLSHDEAGRTFLTLFLCHDDPATGARRREVGFLNALVPALAP
jgi:hypothetical protein